MTPQQRAFFAVDFGSATTGVALIAHVGGRWRLVAHTSGPAADADPLLRQLLDAIRVSEPALLVDLDDDAARHVENALETWPRLEARSSPRRRIAVLAAVRREGDLLAAIARRAGWEVVAGTADEEDPLELTSLILSPATDALLVGADDPPSGDERRLLGQVASLAAAAVARRAGLPVILAGGAGAEAHLFRESGDGGEIDAARGEPPIAGERAGTDGHHAGGRGTTGGRETTGGPGGTGGSGGTGGPGRAVLAPAASAGHPAGSALHHLLESLRARDDDSRLAMTRTLRSLAFVLDRSIELVEVGLDGGLRCRAEPVPGDGHREVASFHATLEAAGFAPPDPSEELLDAVLSWSAMPLDRYRLGDRVRDLRLSPWGDADGEGLGLRLAAARAALDRLVAATPDISERAAPDLLIGAGGVWAPVPPPVVALALADVVRRPGASQLALDHARLLAPLGVIEDEDDRRLILADLADDLLLPLGSIIVPAGLRAGQALGTLRIENGDSVAEVELLPGGIELVDLPPGQDATADLDFHETVHLGARGRHFATEVTGGLGGLLVDLRDVPLRLPERGEERRQLLWAWQHALWPEVE